MEFLTDFSIYEVLSWAQVNARKLEVARHASNILLAAYMLSYMLNRKSCFLVAFLLVELIGNLRITDDLSMMNYYFMYSIIYCSIYWYGFYNYFKLKTLFCYAMLMLFEFGMTIDAYIYPEDKTFIYQSYEFVIVAFHLLIVASLFKRQNIRRGLGNLFASFTRVFSANYNFAFVWYTIGKKVYPSKAKT